MAAPARARRAWALLTDGVLFPDSSLPDVWIMPTDTRLDDHYKIFVKLDGVGTCTA